MVYSHKKPTAFTRLCILRHLSEEIIMLEGPPSDFFLFFSLFG